MANGEHKNSQSGITLVELLVVLVILGIATATAGPAMMNGIDKFALNSTGRKLVAAFRSAQVEAKLGQQELIGSLNDGEFVFVKGGKRVANLRLPADIEVQPADVEAAYNFLTSGQILGPPRLDLVLRGKYKGSLILGPGPGAFHFEEQR